jgi:hypothetical protein
MCFPVSKELLPVKLRPIIFPDLPWFKLPDKLLSKDISFWALIDIDKSKDDNKIINLFICSG